MTITTLHSYFYYSQQLLVFFFFERLSLVSMKKINHKSFKLIAFSFIFCLTSAAFAADKKAAVKKVATPAPAPVVEAPASTTTATEVSDSTEPKKMTISLFYGLTGGAGDTVLYSGFYDEATVQGYHVNFTYDITKDYGFNLGLGYVKSHFYTNEDADSWVIGSKTLTEAPTFDLPIYYIPATFRLYAVRSESLLDFYIDLGVLAEIPGTATYEGFSAEEIGASHANYFAALFGIGVSKFFTPNHGISLKIEAPIKRFSGKIFEMNDDYYSSVIVQLVQIGYSFRF